MTKKVAVENTLERVSQYLADQGYDVQTMYQNDTLYDITSDEYDAVVVSERSYFDRNRIKTNAPIIEAAGSTPEQVYEKIKHGIQ